jgi:hypothetical protein
LEALLHRDSWRTTYETLKEAGTANHPGRIHIAVTLEATKNNRPSTCHV